MMTENEQREIIKKGGMIPGKTRRKNKAIRQIVKDLLQSEPEAMEMIGIEPEASRAALLVRALYNKALTGDAKAFETLMKYSGDDPDQKRRDAELKIKQQEARRRNPEPDKETTVFEQMVKEMYDHPTPITREMLRKIDPRLDILQQLKDIKDANGIEGNEVIINFDV